jgi:hypothetical protein
MTSELAICNRTDERHITTSAHESGHPGFAKTWDIISATFYIVHGHKRLREYLRHCEKCRVFETTRHKPYGALQPIMSPPAPFHTITMDFILALPLSKYGFDYILAMTCKMIKRIALIPGKSTWIAAQWGKAVIRRLLDLD